MFKGMINTLKELFNLFYQLFWPIGYLCMYLTQGLSQKIVSTIIISYHILWRGCISVHDRVGVVHIDPLEFGRRYLMHFGYMHIFSDNVCISYNYGVQNMYILPYIQLREIIITSRTHTTNQPVYFTWVKGTLY